MKRDSIFFGGALIVIGVLFLLQSLGIINNVFQYFWPLAMLAVGIWLILGVYWKPAPSPEDSFSIPMGLAQSVSYRFSHGVGSMEIRGGAPAGVAMTGTAGNGMNRSSRMNGDQLEVRVDAGPSFLPFVGPSEGTWRFQLTQDLPVQLKVESGASSINLDLRDVLATHIDLNTGASSANITMPARGISFMEVESGANSINILVPEATAARIRIRDGVTSMDVDSSRFPLQTTGFYQSPDYDTATNRAEIEIESGLGKVTVR